MIFQIFGQITPPYVGNYNQGQDNPGGIIFFLNNVLRLLFVIGGLILLFNLVFAGFQFLNAGGDPKAIEQAWNKIWQSLVGILIIVVSFLIAAIVGFLFFGDPAFLLQPHLLGP